MPLEDFVLADTVETLQRCLAGLGDLSLVGVDVERADWNRYWRAPALIQVGGDGRVVLVDPIAIDDLSPLTGFLSARTAVFHAMENDLAPLNAVGVAPGRVEDTAVAAALLGMATGLESLLAELLGVDVVGDKQAMQREDWEARPLRAEMLAYAAGDVADLPALWTRLWSRLCEAGRDDWYRQELDALRAQPPVEQRRAWTKTKGVGRLDAAVRARVRALWEARESLTRSTDTAPARILADRTLVSLASEPVFSVRELARRGVRRQAIRKFGGVLLDALRRGEDAQPEPLSGARRVTEVDRERVDRLREIRAARARELDIDPGVLCPSRTLMSALIQDPATPERLRSVLGLRAWQWEQLGPAFCDALGIDTAGKPVGAETKECHHG